MGFVEATQGTPQTDSGAPSGKMYHIAVMAWFRSTGDPIPMSFKFQDDSGQIQSVKEIDVRYSEDRNYSGIPSKEYGCEAIIGGMIRAFKLIFYTEACKWVMVIPGVF